MKQSRIRTDSIYLKKRNLRIYRVRQHNAATVLWLSEQQAAQHIQRLHIEKLLVTRRYQ
jgi:hypothetical protein